LFVIALTSATPVAILHLIEEEDARRVDLIDLIQALDEEIETVDEEMKMLLAHREAMAKWQAAPWLCVVGSLAAVSAALLVVLRAYQQRCPVTAVASDLH
jgi:hypothetical protein